MVVPFELDIERLTVEERIQLAEALWDSISPPPRDFELTEEQKAELDRRLAEYEADPEAGEAWEDVKARLLAKT